MRDEVGWKPGVHADVAKFACGFLMKEPPAYLIEDVVIRPQSERLYPGKVVHKALATIPSGRATLAVERHVFGVLQWRSSFEDDANTRHSPGASAGR